MQKEKALLISAQKWGRAAPTAALEAGPSQQPGLPGPAPAPNPLPGTWPSPRPWPWPLRSERGRQNVAPSLPGLRGLDPNSPTWACLPPLSHRGVAAPAGKPEPAPPSLLGRLRAPLMPSAPWAGVGGVGERMLPTAGAAQGRRVQHGQEWNGGLETEFRKVRVGRVRAFVEPEISDTINPFN